MNTIWLKIAAGALVIFVVLILVAHFLSPGRDASEPRAEEEPAQKNKTVYDVAEEDKRKYSVPPVTDATPTPEPAPVVATPAPATTPTPVPASVPATPELPRVVTIYVKPLDEIDKMQAEKLLSVAIPGKSIGNMRAGYTLAVQNSKQLIQDYPDSAYAYQAKRLLADIPERHRERYKLTPELLDVSRFYKPRPGTQPMQLPAEE